MPWATLYLLSEWIIRILMLIYVPQRRSAAASRTWLLLIFLLPWPGLLLYALLGRIYVSQKRLQLQFRSSRHIKHVQEHLSNLISAESALPENLQPIFSLATQLGDFHPFAGNQVELLCDYEETLDRLRQDIDAAKHQIHLLFYIYATDATGMRVTEALERAAARGVKCRVLLDAVGSKKALRELRGRMHRSGIEIQAALPVGLFRRNAARFDLRNHRKLAVIDGHIAYTGSQNIVDAEFITGHPNEEMMARVRGPVVAQLQGVFLADYFAETGRSPTEVKLFPEVSLAGHSVAQTLPSGPGYQRENAHDLILEMLYTARERVVITTPYFVPDEAVLIAIRAARRRNVDVRLVVSERSNHRVTQLAQESYYDELLDVGVGIYLYQPRLLHAKHISIDDGIVFLGSTNMDIRSFALNAELNLLVYDPEVVARLRSVQERYFSNSRQLLGKEWKQRPLLSRVLQNTARLADSLL